MKLYFSTLLAGLIAATFATTVAAMPSGAALQERPSPYPMDCAKAKDKARCAALNEKIKSCRNRTDDEWHECMYQSARTANFTPPKPRDCSKARNRDLCEAHSAALEACKDKRTRAEHRKCITGQLQAASLPKN